MKSLISAAILCCAVFLSAQNLNVMSFNIRLSTDSDKENSWENRKQDAFALMAYYHPDVMGVQEALPQQMNDIQNALKGYRYIGVGRDDGKEKGEFSAVFYNAEKFKVLDSGTFWLSETPEIPSKGWDAAYNRVCSYALLNEIKTGKQFWAFNIHFDHVGNEARVQSANLILKKMQKLNQQNFPVVLTGDFNLTEEAQPIQILSSHLKDSYHHSLTPHYGPKGTFQDFDTQKVSDERIDYIFVKGFKVLSSRTINDRRENLLYPSDHFPVLAELSFEK